MLDFTSPCALPRMTVMYCLSVGKGCTPLTLILSPLWAHYTQYNSSWYWFCSGVILCTFLYVPKVCLWAVKHNLITLSTLGTHWVLFGLLDKSCLTKDILEVTVCLCTFVCDALPACAHSSVISSDSLKHCEDCCNGVSTAYWFHNEQTMSL